MYHELYTDRDKIRELYIKSKLEVFVRHSTHDDNEVIHLVLRLRVSPIH